MIHQAAPWLRIPTRSSICGVGGKGAGVGGKPAKLVTEKSPCFLKSWTSDIYLNDHEIMNIAKYKMIKSI